MLEQRKAGLRSEVDVCLVNGNHPRGHRDHGFDIGHRKQRTGRRVRVDDELEGSGVRPETGRQLPRELGGMCGRLGLVHAAKRLEERIGGGRIGNGIAGARERAEAHLDQLVSAVAHDHLRGFEFESPGDGLARRLRGWARIEAERIGRGSLDRLDHPRRGRQRRLVGVELDPALTIRRLLAGRVGLEPLERPPYDAFRHSSRKVSKANRGLTFCSR